MSIWACWELIHCVRWSTSYSMEMPHCSKAATLGSNPSWSMDICVVHYSLSPCWWLKKVMSHTGHCIVPNKRVDISLKKRALSLQLRMQNDQLTMRQSFQVEDILNKVQASVLKIWSKKKRHRLHYWKFQIVIWNGLGYSTSIPLKGQ